MTWSEHARLEAERARREKRASRQAAALPLVVLLLKADLRPQAIARRLDELAVPSPSGTAPWSRLAVRRIIRRWCDDNGVNLQPQPYSREWDYERFVRAFEGVE